MRKIMFFILTALLTINTIEAQKELWGYKAYLGYLENPPLWYSGQIIKVPLFGNNSTAQVIHTFDITGILGKFPCGKLFQASNGKLYGVTGLEIIEVGGIFQNSVLFEYDLILGKYKVITQLNYPTAGVIEPLPGILIGTTNKGNSIYKYNFNTGVFAITASIPSFFVPDLGSGTTYYPGANGELMKASDGNLYFTSDVSVNGPPDTTIGVQLGGIYKYDLTNNTFSKLYYFGQSNFGGGFGFMPLQGKLVEGNNGKLYGITRSGFINYNPNSYCDIGCGVLYEFDIYTNTLTQKHEFDYSAMGGGPGQLLKVSNTKIWGTTQSIQQSFPVFPNKYGLIYEYDIPTSTVNIKHAINYPADDSVSYLYGMGTKASDGNYYSMYEYGIYKYDPITNTIKRKLDIDSQARIFDMIEVCRKPSYQEFLPNTYAPEQGTEFTYNIQNTNATTYVWKKGTTILPTQTTGILNLPSVTASDTGIYTCTMTNECGVTVTMPLNINVTNLATETIDNYKEFITLHPNPTKGSINLKFPENRGLKAISYKVTNLLGQVVLENDIAKNNTATSITIDTAGFANGIYQVTLETDKGNWNGKFVKE